MSYSCGTVLQMNQLCRVCGEPAAGFHFGAFTCEGCKSFFGRTYSNLSSISECKNNGECVINKKNRTSCKACRLRKCLLVGMSKSGSRYGRRSNWFKIHCLLQEQQQHHHQGGTSPALREPLSAKNKVLPLWDGQRRHLMDVDNNNTGAAKGFADAKPRTLSPSPMMQVRSLQPAAHPGYPSDAAAALWAARNTLLPLQMSPHNHINPSTIPPLPVPFLTSPFLHGGGFHPYPGQPTKNFFLPFVHSISSPKHLPSERLVPTTTSSSSSSASSSPPSPLREQKEEVVSKPDPRLRPPEERLCFDKSVAVLQALGPVQEQPIDLSVKGSLQPRPKHRRKSSGKSSSDNSDEDDFGSDASSDVEFSEDKDSKEGTEDGVGRGAEDRKQRTTPLDLTTRT